MQEEKWQEVLEKIRSNFDIEEHETTDLEDVPNATVETVVFNSPMGRIMVERTLKPKVVDKKTLYSSRAGAAVNVDYEYSDTDMVSTVEVFKWNEISDDWQKADINL